jgi:uncharacterized membrane protein YqgA involved in biofilm formation
MIGTWINAAAVVAGSSLGLVFRKNLPKKYEDVYFQVVGLFSLVLGIQMALGMGSPLLVLFSLVLGGFFGARMKLDKRIDRFGGFLKKHLRSDNERFSEGLVTAFLLFCMGSMTIVGAIEEGFGQKSDLLMTKSMLDFFSSLMLASGLGVGVLFSVVPLVVFQGGITLLVSLIGRDIPAEIITEITATGGIILMGLSLNLLRIKELKIINLLPALLLICLFVWLKIMSGV